LNFEKVEIYGFKSFADKAEIKFGNGITGIVGPNGCGKSNVADAIRWVLGEQSAKQLRGGSMQDVIFSGTQDRRSLSYCEVSLYFDNSTKMFSLDYSEVIITRKLYRSGESEYFINKQPARLKDIIALLHECGIGKEGYTIIGQGKVEEIMSAKPEDRRAIFEEATGIAKFKGRKVESERKLERTHANLVRYTDILTEIENQLAPLEKQAAKAKEYNELCEELKHHELNTYIAKVEGVETAKLKITVRIKGLDEETTLRQQEYNLAQEEYEKIFAEINAADVRLRTLNDELLEKRVGMEKSSGAKQLFEQKISYLQSQIERAEREIKDSLSFINDCKTSISLNESELNKNKTELNALLDKASKISSRLQVVTEKISLGEELASANQKMIIKSIESLSDIKMSRSAISIQQENVKEKIDELTTRLDELCVRREGLFNEKDNRDNLVNELDRAVFDYKNQITEKEDEVRAVNEDAAKLDNSIYSLNTHIVSLATKDNFYRSIKENYEGYSPAVKVLLNNAKQNPELKKRVMGVVATLIKSDKKYDVALETALAAAAQNVVTKNPEDAKYLIEYLKANKVGRVTFLPITSVKPRNQTAEVTSALNERGALGVANALIEYDSQFENVISNLLGNTLIVDTLENATIIAKKYHFSFKIVTLDGEVFSTQGSITGGARRNDAPGILSSERRLEDNAKLLAEKKAEMEKLQKQKEEFDAKRDACLDELSMLNDMYNSKRQELFVEREKLALSEKALSEIGREIEGVTDIIDELKARLVEISARLEDASIGGKKLEEDKENASLNAGKHQAEFDALKKERDTLTEESTKIQIEVTSIRGVIDRLVADNERLVQTAKETEENVSKLKLSNEGAEKIIEELKLEQEKVALTKEEQDEVNAIRDKIENIEVYKAELREKLSKNGETRERITEQLNVLTEKKHHEELALTKIDSDLEYMGQSIFEDYQETYETAQASRVEGYDASHGEQEIARIRRRRNSLGAINASAIEDFKMLKERYEEMTTQKEDLEKAEADLKTVIDKLKAEMLTQFDEGFNKINENFQKIFKELFGGGRAMLQMDYTQVEDRLEAGVEIVAEPPGKKLQKLSLLSGGEKALTAIAILFAILKMRPMPFCVLDEVEAALDEANVDRFAKYLQKFSDETQFIVITHKKPTMERADALFGVTMQEKGVSKMVSVKLADVEKWSGDGITA